MLYGEGPVTGAMKCYDDVINSYGDAQQRFAERVAADVIEPLKAYLEIFKDVKKRTDEVLFLKTITLSFCFFVVHSIFSLF